MAEPNRSPTDFTDAKAADQIGRAAMALSVEIDRLDKENADLRATIAELKRDRPRKIVCMTSRLIPHPTPGNPPRHELIAAMTDDSVWMLSERGGWTRFSDVPQEDDNT